MVKVSMTYCFSFSRYQTKCVIKFLFRQFDDIINFKGNPNSQGISNWIIQILHYYYSKQHKNIENSQIIKQNLVIFSLPFSLFTVACASFTFLAAVFQFFKRHKWSFMKYIFSLFWFENGFLWYQDFDRFTQVVLRKPVKILISEQYIPCWNGFY